MGKIFGRAAALIGLVAAVVALLQTFSVNPLPKATLIVRCAQPDPMSTMFNFLEDLEKNKGHQENLQWE